MRGRSILLAVTIDDSLQFLEGFPRFLSEEGWEVHVVSGPGPRLDALSEIPNVTTHAISMRRDPALLSDLRSLVQWLRLIRRLRPDMVAVGTPKAGLLGTVAAFLCRVHARVYTLHGLRLETATGLPFRILRAVERLTIRMSTTTVAVSPSLMQLALQMGLAKPSKITVLGQGSCNGVDLDRFRPSQSAGHNQRHSPVEESLPVVGFVGRITAEKGLHTLAGALTILKNKAIDCRLLLLGSLDDETGYECMKALSESGQVIDAVNHVTDTSPYYQQMDVLCLPSFREGLPTVVLEAFASGVVTIASDATGSRDLVVPEETGLLFPIGDAKLLAAGLERLFAGDSLRLSLSASALERVRKEFARYVVQTRYAQFYRNLLSGSRGGYKFLTGED